MNDFQAFILGLVQGLTEYLPVSSSGHLSIMSSFMDVDGADNLAFTVAVHVATVLSTLVIFWKQIVWIFRDRFKLAGNEGTSDEGLIGVSRRPVGIVGVCFKDKVEEVFGSGLLIVGIMLLVTASLLSFSYFAKPRQKEKISLKDAFVIGLAQAVAVMPGLSRSGSTIATGLLLGDKKEKLAQFSFLMVIPPILGEALLDTLKMMKEGVGSVMGDIPVSAMAIGFVTAFVFGCVACRWMVDIVKRGKLIYFAVYCAVVGVVTIAVSFL